MKIEQSVNSFLNRYPDTKRYIKSIYQHIMYAVSPKIKIEGNIIRVSPNDPNYEYFFGYYDKSPWDSTGRFMLCLRARDTWSNVAPKEPADLLIIDTEKQDGDHDRIRVLGQTHSWNVQQGCMLQWLGPDFSTKVIYNDFRNGRFCSIILDISTMEERIIELPIYTVSENGKIALTLDFTRLHRLRPGYGYSNISESTANEKLPDKDCIWKINLENGDIEPLFKYTDFASFEPRYEMVNAEHKVNHLMISPNGERFMVLHRWFDEQRKYTRLITCNIDGTDIYNLSDDDMVSHCYWKNNDEILAFEHKRDGGNGYYLMKDRSKKYTKIWPEICNDGHPSFSPNREWVVIDTYPNRTRMQEIKVAKLNTDMKVIARVFAPFKYDNDTRCDLHPRWNRTGDKICFDSVFEGYRRLYVVNVEKDSGFSINNYNLKITVIVPVYQVKEYLERCVQSIVNQSYNNLEIILVDDGSTDGSAELCDLISQKDDRIKIIHKKNGGLSSARNAGLNIATGDYITFVDSDDWIDKDIYYNCISTIVQKKVEVVDYECILVDNENKNVYQTFDESCIGNIIFDDDILKDYLYRGQTDDTPFSVCRKIYKMTLFDSVRFPEGKINEDIATNYIILRGAKSLVHLKYKGYYYYQRSQSITNGSFRNKDFNLLETCDLLCDLANESGKQEIIDLAKIKRNRSYFSLLSKMALYGISDEVQNPQKLVKEYVYKLRKGYYMLIKSPMPLNRKIIMTAYCINYKISCSLIRMLGKIKK